MGFQTELCILNDAWPELRHHIMRDPGGFTDDLDLLMNGRPISKDGEYVGRAESGEIQLPRHVGYSTVYRSHHADDARLYIAWRNSLQALDPYVIRRELEYRDSRLFLEALERDVLEAQRLLTATRRFLKKERA